MKKQHTGQHYQGRSVHPCDKALFSFSFLLFAELISIGQISYKPRLSQSKRNTESKCAPPLSLAGKCHGKKDLGILFGHFPSSQCWQSIKICTLGLYQFEATPGVCDEQSSLSVQSFIISITKRRVEDNYIVWTNQSVRRSICHGGRVQHLTGSD